MRLLYLGLPLGALALLREGHELVGACVSRPSMPGMRRLRRALAARGAPLLGRPDLTQPTVQSLLASTEPELVVSWFWTRRIPSTVVALASHGGVNVHPSLLPKYRGPDPYFWTILHGDAETGVTVHRISANYDDGDVLLQRRVAVPPDVNALQLARLLDRPSLGALRDAIALIARGEDRDAPQDAAAATSAPRPSDDDCEILWDQPVEAVLRRIRAAAPDPGAFTGFGDETIVVLRARKAGSVPRWLEPGDVVLTDEGVVVGCGTHEGVLLVEAQHEDREGRLWGRDVAQLFPGVTVI